MSKFVLITRPEVDGQAFAQVLAQDNISTILSPVLEINYLDNVHLDLTNIQALLVTSLNGARALGAVTQRRDIPVYAVGSGTQEILSQHGFMTIKSAQGDTGSLEKLVVESLDPDQGRVLYVHGDFVAGNLEQALKDQGFVVDSEVLYEAQAEPILNERAVEALKSRQIAQALFFSPRTMEQFLVLAERAGVLKDLAHVQAVCLSEAVAHVVPQPSPWRRLVVAPEHRQESLRAVVLGRVSGKEFGAPIGEESRSQDFTADPVASPQDISSNSASGMKKTSRVKYWFYVPLLGFFSVITGMLGALFLPVVLNVASEWNFLPEIIKSYAPVARSEADKALLNLRQDLEMKGGALQALRVDVEMLDKRNITLSGYIKNIDEKVEVLKYSYPHLASGFTFVVDDGGLGGVTVVDSDKPLLDTDAREKKTTPEKTREYDAYWLEELQSSKKMLQEHNQRLARIESEEIKADTVALAFLALNHLKSRADKGIPFDKALESLHGALRPVRSDVIENALSQLRRVATFGVPTLLDFQKRFKSLSDRILMREAEFLETDKWTDKAVAYLKTFVAIRNNSSLSVDINRTLNLVVSALETWDIDEAVRLIETLPAYTEDVWSRWVLSANKRIMLDQAIEGIQNDIVRALQTSAL